MTTLSTATAPLPPARPLLDGEDPHTPDALAPELAATAEEALEALRFNLSMLAGCTLTPALLAVAEEMHGTAAHLAQLADRFAVEAAA